MMDELIDQADMYANICTQQEEKYTTWQRWGCPWRWRDCEAAWSLVAETTTGRERYDMMQRSTRRVAKVESYALMALLAQRYDWQLTEAFEWDTAGTLP